MPSHASYTAFYSSWWLQLAASFSPTPVMSSKPLACSSLWGQILSFLVGEYMQSPGIVLQPLPPRLHSYLTLSCQPHHRSFLPPQSMPHATHVQARPSSTATKTSTSCWCRSFLFGCCMTSHTKRLNHRARQTASASTIVSLQHIGLQIHVQAGPASNHRTQSMQKHTPHIIHKLANCNRRCSRCD